jgi:hypothetical protein
MNKFQIVALAVLSILSLWCLRGWLILGRRRMALGLPVFVAAGVAIAYPRSTQSVAEWLGIGRGTDLVVYLTAFAAIGCYFLTLYSHRRLRMQLTELTRQIALGSLPTDGRSAEWGSDGGSGGGRGGG